jgi:RHS repeat-associated protein
VQFWHGGGPGTNWIEFQQTFSYDGANRLTAATDSGGWWRSFGYDQYGNLWVTGNGGVPLAGNTPTWNVYNGHNQISGISYDAAGNQLVANGDTLSYDAENRMVSATEPPALGGATETYVYDGNGQRVQKMGPNGTTTYVYDAFGNLAAEYGTVTSAACTTCYLSYDHLGSVRLVTDQNANVVARHDYLPFGEEIPANTAGRNSQWGLTADVEQKFTGQIRDNETGMDYFNARYLTGALGRFNSSDPLNLGADATDPQTWNGYAYVRNNPLALVDPMGLCTFDAEGNAVEDENGACYEGGFGGSVTVTASPPPDVMPIFVSLPSLLSDTQQPMQSAPPAVTETGVGIKPPNSGTTNKAPVCFAQLKSRPVNDPTAAKFRAVHTFWWVQGSSGQRIISGGPNPPSGSNQYLTVWVNPNLNQGPDTPSAHLVFNSGLSGGICGQVDSMINAGQSFPNGSLTYDPVWGPNSNTAARYFGDVGGFNPSFPFTAYGANAPLLVPQVP